MNTATIVHGARHKRQRVVIAAITMLLGGPAFSHETKIKDLQIVHPWVRGQEQEGQTPPRDLVVAMSIFNRGLFADRLIGISSPLASGGELRAGGQGVNAVAVAPADRLALVPDPIKDGATSLVLHGVTDDLAGYETFPVWLTFEHAGRVEIAVFVEDYTIKNPSCSGSLQPGELHAHN